jgi:hypothetical protein
MVTKTGNKTHMTVQMPIGLISEVDEIIKQKSLGFRSRNEFCVDCVRRIVRTYQNNNSNKNYQPPESGEERGEHKHEQMAEKTSTKSNTGLDNAQGKSHRADEKRLEDPTGKAGKIESMGGEDASL